MLSCRQLAAATEKLGKQLRALTTTALRVIAVQPLGAASRQTAPFHPLPHPAAGAAEGTGGPHGVPRCLEPIELLVRLEGSGVLLLHPTKIWTIIGADILL